MVFRNTQSNQLLVQRLTEAVNQHPGYRANVDLNWNCGKDIRFEIGTSHEMCCPFTVGTSCTDAGHFGIKVRMLQTELNGQGIQDLKAWLEDLEPIADALTELIREAKPQRAYYAM